MLKSIIINGILSGTVYALLAVGFSLVFGVARILNFSHTVFYMLSAYFMFTVTSYLGLNVYIAVIVAVVGAVLIGIVSYILFIDRIREHDITVLMITIALALAFQEIIILIFGSHYRGVPNFIEGKMEILGVTVIRQHLIVLGIIAVFLFGIWVLLSKTKLGIKIRATAQDRQIANLMGINVSRICLITVAISVAMAATCGAVVAPIFVVDPTMWMEPLFMVIAIVVLGGLGSVKGSFYAAFIMGFTQTIVVFVLPMGSFVKGAVAMVVMLIILLLRPEGLFGVVFEEERL